MIAIHHPDDLQGKVAAQMLEHLGLVDEVHANKWLQVDGRVVVLNEAWMETVLERALTEPVVGPLHFWGTWTADRGRRGPFRYAGNVA